MATRPKRSGEKKPDPREISRWMGESPAPSPRRDPENPGAPRGNGGRTLVRPAASTESVDPRAVTEAVRLLLDALDEIVRQLSERPGFRASRIRDALSACRGALSGGRRRS